MKTYCRNSEPFCILTLVHDFPSWYLHSWEAIASRCHWFKIESAREGRLNGKNYGVENKIMTLLLYFFNLFIYLNWHLYSLSIKLIFFFFQKNIIYLILYFSRNKLFIFLLGLFLLYVLLNSFAAAKFNSLYIILRKQFLLASK